MTNPLPTPRDHDIELAIADAYRAGAEGMRERAAKLAEACKMGVAVECDNKPMPLGALAHNPCDAQKTTAEAIAFAIRALPVE